VILYCTAAAGIDTVPAASMGKWDFSGDEVVFLLAAALVGLVGAALWYGRIARMRAARGGRASKLILTPLPPLALLALLYVLQHWADPKYVVGQLDYILLFMAGGATWLWIAAGISALMGVSARDDALERGNTAAAITLCGALGGAIAIYAWCNVGAGPTIWTTIWPAAVATIVWAVLWSVVEATTHLSDAIAIDRDPASALRLTGGLLAIGLVLGRGMAGDWTSWDSTFREFVRIGWVALPLAVAIIVLHYVLRPTPSRPRPGAISAGLLPAAILLSLAIAYVVAQGKPDIGVHVITYEQYTGEKE